MKYGNCEYCGGRVKEQKVRVDHRWKGKLVVVDNTPVGICSKCGERYYNASIIHQLDSIAKGDVGSVRLLKIPYVDFDRAIAA